MALLRLKNGIHGYALNLNHAKSCIRMYVDENLLRYFGCAYEMAPTFVVIVVARKHLSTVEVEPNLVRKWQREIQYNERRKIQCKVMISLPFVCFFHLLLCPLMPECVILLLPFRHHIYFWIFLYFMQQRLTLHSHISVTSEYDDNKLICKTNNKIKASKGTRHNKKKNDQ